jgi:hypothetical protein
MKTSLSIFGIAAATLIGAAPALAQEAQIRYMAVFEGQCQKLSVGGTDLTASCKGALFNIDYGNGRVSFMAATDNALYSFTGTRSEQPDLRSYRLWLDGVNHTEATSNETEPEVLHEELTGTCEANGDPTKEPTTFTCTGENDTTQFVLEFVSNGNPPEVVYGDR